MTLKILLIEDDGVLRTGLKELLTGAGYETVSAGSFTKGREAAENESGVSLYIVDIMLGDGSGLELVREIRARHDTPVIILTALNGEDTVIEGLSCGADDYVTKPFRAGELLARIEANLRRSQTMGTIVSGHIEYRLSDGKLFVAGEERTLRRGERELLELFLKSGGRLLKREYIFDTLWANDADSVDGNTLSVLVSRLRKELGSYNGRPVVETVRGVGYRWALPCVTGK
ncbi:MAG: response regulator transcription factor [Clostridia bacterium]|jgi:DNA-binding response OmpR family regulator|nr:response regulator transcription factor [Clostridia bacterium]